MLSVNSLTPYVNDALCVLALHHASHVALRRYITIAELIPTPKPADGADAASEDVLARPTLLRRIFNKRTWRLSRFWVFYIPFLVLLIYVVPKYGTRLWLDILWSGLIFVFMAGVFSFTVSWLSGTVNTVQIQYNDLYKKWLPKIQAVPDESDKRRNAIIGIMAIALAAVVQASVAYGVTVLQGLVAAALVFGSVANMLAPRFKVKSIVKTMTLIMAVIPVLTALVIGLVLVLQHFFPDSPADKDKSNHDIMATPSHWVESLMLTYTLACPILYAAPMTSLALRFDHVQDYGVPVRRTHGPLPIPQAIDDSFAKPTYRAALVAQLAALLVLRVIIGQTTSDPQMATVLGVFLTTPACMTACLASAKYTGRLKLFWEYEEVWTPTEDEANNMVPLSTEEKPLLSQAGEASGE